MTADHRKIQIYAHKGSLTVSGHFPGYGDFEPTLKSILQLPSAIPHGDCKVT